jgi:hypothetical protein
MYIRWISRSLRSGRRYGPCRCEGVALRFSRTAVLVESAVTPRGPRQRVVATLGSYRTCCVASPAAQKRFWTRIAEVTEPLCERETCSPETLRRLTMRMVQAVSGDLGPKEAVPDLNEQLLSDRSVVAAGSDSDGVTWVRRHQEPDLDRLQAWPEAAGGKWRVLQEIKRFAVDLAEEEEPLATLELYRATHERHVEAEAREDLGSAIRASLEGLGRASTDALVQLKAEVLREATDIALGQEAELNGQLSGDLRKKEAAARRRVEGMTTAIADAMRVAPPGHVPSRKFLTARPVRGGGHGERRAGRRQRPTLNSLSTQVVLAVDLYAAGASQAEVGSQLFPGRSAGAAQRAVSRRLGRFQRELRRTLRKVP